MKSLARRHPITTFLALAYLAAAAIFATPLLSNAGIGLIDLDLPGAAPFVLLSVVSLVAATYATTAMVDGRPGVRDLRRRTFHFRVHPGWYVAALVMLPVAALATAVAITGLDPVVELVERPDVAATVLIGAAVAFLLVNWGEETAWTGFALERLQPRLGPIRASVVTTWMQGALHLPLVFIAGGVTDGRVPADQVPFYLVALFVLPIPVRMAITWIYNSTGRSLPIVGIFHAGLGVAAGSDFIPVLAPGMNTVWVYAGFAALAGIILVATRGRLGYRGAATEATMGRLASVNV